MKVKELIAELSKQDQDAEVLERDDNNNLYIVNYPHDIGKLKEQTVFDHNLPKSLVGKNAIILQRKTITMEYDLNNEPEPGVRKYCEVCGFWHNQNAPCLCTEKNLTPDEIKAIYESAQNILKILLDKAEQSNFENSVDPVVLAELEYIINLTNV